MRLRTINQQFEKELLIRAKKSLVEINTKNIFVIGKCNNFVMITTVVDFEKIDPIDYNKGVNFAFGYFAISELYEQVPSNYYTLRTNLDKVSVGKIKGKIDFINSKGRLTYSMPAKYSISSLNVPYNSKGRIRISHSKGIFPCDHNQIGEETQSPEDDDFCLGIPIKCDNGSTICLGFRIPIDDPSDSIPPSHPHL